MTVKFIMAYDYGKGDLKCNVTRYENKAILMIYPTTVFSQIIGFLVFENFLAIHLNKKKL